MQNDQNWQQQLRNYIGSRKMSTNVINLFVHQLGIYVIDTGYAPLLSKQKDKSKNERKFVKESAGSFWTPIMIFEKQSTSDGQVDYRCIRNSPRRYFATADILLNLKYQEYTVLRQKDNGSLMEDGKALGLNFDSRFYKQNNGLCRKFFEVFETHLQENGYKYEWKRAVTGSNRKSHLKVLVITKVK